MSNATTNTIPTHQLHQDQLHVLAADEGPRLDVLNNLGTVKATAGDTGSMTAVEFLAPHGFGPPLHVHDDEDELVVVLEGRVAFRSGDDEIIADAGGCAYLPHAVPHVFQVLSDQARMLSVTSRVGGPAPRFDRMMTALGTPTESTSIPEPMEIDPGRVAEVCAQHGVTVLGPPPAPLVN